MLSKLQAQQLQKSLNKHGGDLVDVFGVLGDKNRFRIVKLLKSQGELCVSDLASVLGLSVSGASQHLRILELAGLVECQRMGQMICYKLRIKTVTIENLLKLL